MKTKRAVKLYTAEFDDLDDYAERDGDPEFRPEPELIECEPDDFDTAEGITAVDLAVEVLQDRALVESSSWPHHVGDWYSHPDGAQIVDYYSGRAEEQSAHLIGFTPDEEREINRKILGK